MLSEVLKLLIKYNSILQRSTFRFQVETVVHLSLPGKSLCHYQQHKYRDYNDTDEGKDSELQLFDVYVYTC